MTAIWDISECEDWKEIHGNKQVIFKLHWNCSDSREYPNPDPEGAPLMAYGSVVGTCILNISDIQDFTPYNQITKDQALGWLFSVMTVEQKAKSEIHVEQQILNQIDPPTESGLPWS